MTRGDDLPQDLRDFCFSFAGKSLGRSRWHAATRKCRMTEPLARSDAKKSLDGPAGSKATLKSRLTTPLARSDAKKSLDDAAGTQRRQKVA
ncbi:hypothetical protein T230_11725 [Tannerella sp. oral taxon BU063 isolate Cell 1/3]|uniref:Uncharacterized protein n=1 Tax=Tannerella sp. oral taxon BU063 isolate Cell 1/3 TaxID=1411022 RepID=W2CJK0_9BACT|nr:hypothetical protein T230_11725 [Tannerella sp. oral taxon BU063 isolate Cell 1/3]